MLQNISKKSGPTGNNTLKWRRVALDSNIFIYALEDNLDFPQAKELLFELVRQS